MSLPRLLYVLLLYIAAPLVLLRLLWRARRQPEYLRHVAERWGWYRGDSGTASCIWVHAVSVGETRAAEPLVRALRQRYPRHRIVLTHMTPTGRAAGQALFGDGVLQCYLPYDYPGAVVRFLEHFRPDAGVILETEIWPNLIHAGALRNIPLYLVNARLSEQSLRGYRRVAGLGREALDAFTVIAAQTAADAERLQQLGCRRVVVTGNLKFDVDPPALQIERGGMLRASLGARAVLLAASTREGEEALLLDAACAAGLRDAVLIIVPRHPQRFDAVAALIAGRGLRLQRHSSGVAPAADTQALLGDTMGEMFMFYAASDVVLLGGSFLPYGAQNLIEPCAVGKPVIIGPSVYNFTEAAAAAVAAGAALQVADMSAAISAAMELAADPERCARMGAAGQAFTAEHRGATQRLLEHIAVAPNKS